MATKNLLVELFVEELPPKALKILGEVFADVLFDQLKSQGLTTAESVWTSMVPSMVATPDTASSLYWVPCEVPAIAICKVPLDVCE